MSSDLFITQLVTQSFSSGSSFGNVSGSATAKQFGCTTECHDMAGGDSSFESTLNRVSDTETTSNVSISSGGGQTAPREHAGRSVDSSADVSQEMHPTDNLLGVSRNHQGIGVDGALDPNLSAGINMLMAILNGQENAVMLNNQSSQPSGPVASDTICMLSDTLGATGDQASVSTDGSHTMLGKLGALLKQFETAGETKRAIEIRHLIEQFASTPGDDASKPVKTAEVAKLLQSLTALSQNGLGVGESQNQSIRQADHSQTGNLALNVKPGAADLAKLLATTAVSPNGSSDMIGQQETSENINLESNAQGKQALSCPTSLAMPKAAPAGVQIPVNERTPSAMHELNDLSGQKEMTGLVLNKSPDGGFNQENPGPVIHANSASQPQQNDAVLQNAKVVSLKTDGAPAEALAGKMVNADSGNQESGFTFSGQQQNEVRTAEGQYIAAEAEMVQKKFRTQTLDQIVQKAALHLKNGQNEVQINLKPDFLGQIRMQIVTDSHQVTVRILAEFPMVKELIENNAHQLRSELQNYGLDIDELEVSVSQHSDQHVADQNRASGSSGRNNAENKTTGEDREPVNRAASSTTLVSDDVANTRIDFFA